MEEHLPDPIAPLNEDELPDERYAREHAAMVHIEAVLSNGGAIPGVVVRMHGMQYPYVRVRSTGDREYHFGPDSLMLLMISFRHTYGPFIPREEAEGVESSQLTAQNHELDFTLGTDQETVASALIRSAFRASPGTEAAYEAL